MLRNLMQSDGRLGKALLRLDLYAEIKVAILVFDRAGMDGEAVMTTAEIMRVAGLSYPSADKAIRNLVRKGYITVAERHFKVAEPLKQFLAGDDDALENLNIEFSLGGDPKENCEVPNTEGPDPKESCKVLPTRRPKGSLDIKETFMVLPSDSKESCEVLNTEGSDLKESCEVLNTEGPDPKENCEVLPTPGSKESLGVKESCEVLPTDSKESCRVLPTTALYIESNYRPKDSEDSPKENLEQMFAPNISSPSGEAAVVLTTATDAEVDAQARKSKKKPEVYTTAGPQDKWRVKKPDTWNAVDLCNVFRDRFQKKIGVKYSQITNKDRKQMKELIEAYDSELVAKAIDYLLENYGKYITGYPSIAVLYGFRNSIFPAAQGAVLQGGRKTDVRETKLTAEDIEKAKGREDVVGW